MTDASSHRGQEWDELSALFGAYLNQDWDLVYGDVWNAVRDFRSGEPPAAVCAAADQVRRLLDGDQDEERLKSAIEQLGIEYNPVAHGWTHLGWLSELEKFLRSGADA